MRRPVMDTGLIHIYCGDGKGKTCLLYTSNRSIAGQAQLRQRLADDSAPADDDDFLAGQLDAVIIQNRHDGLGRTRHKSRPPRK